MPKAKSELNKHRKKRQRDGLYRRQGGLCYYCAQPMLKDWQDAPHKSAPRNLATLEHLDSRLNPARGTRPGEHRRVLACKACNEKKGYEAERALGVEALRRRSKKARPSCLIQEGGL